MGPPVVGTRLSPARDQAHDQQAHPSDALLNVTPQCTIILLQRNTDSTMLG
jgi:hypothetical protein